MYIQWLAYAVSGSAVVAAAALAEAYRIKISNVTISSDRLPSSFDGFTILHITDLHTVKFGRLERKIFRLLDQFSPDVVAATGDLAVAGSGVDPLCRMLAGVRANVGKFAVSGNAEHNLRHIGRRLAAALPGSGVRVLNNGNFKIEREGRSIMIAGVDDPFTDHADLDRALEGSNPDEFTLLLAHSPGLAAEAASAGIDLMLSGHTHGGQFRLPFLPAPYVHMGDGPRLAGGLYEGERLSRLLGRDAGRTRIYVSRGLGASYVPARLFCPPEIVNLTLRIEK